MMRRAHWVLQYFFKTCLVKLLQSNSFSETFEVKLAHEFR